MTSLFESDFRMPSYFFMQQDPDQNQKPLASSPYFFFQSGGVNPGSFWTSIQLRTALTNAQASFTPYFPQNVFMNSLHQVQNEYDSFVNGVVSNVLIHVESESPTTPLQSEPPALPDQYPMVAESCDDLMWGSDLSFGPNGFRPLPNSPPSHPNAEDLVYLYTKSIRPLSHRPPEVEPAPVPQSPERSPSSPEERHEPAPELTELNRGGVQKITGKKRRRLLHIIAERNRRLNQNKMYEELYRLVPGLEISTRSTKRDVLTRTADWLEDLVEGNKKLEAQLRQLQATGAGSLRGIGLG
ncbi:basic helix-loop-helix domain-containing protein [Aspergillus lucknowensis]|uniref:BHLH domain-containing protein n=1 Tax=Aspergillus lucknowensis TaxID=176173 RepID=A0ABR4M1A2_9EURO